MKIALVGGGPRALWAVEELVQLAWQRGLTFAVDVYDAGPVKPYAQSQPDYWIMNVDASIVPGFREDTGITTPYPPRAVVGEYLQERWERLDPPAGVTITHIARRVDTGGDKEALRRHLQADFVLEVTGHDATWDGALDGALQVYTAGNAELEARGKSEAGAGTRQGLDVVESGQTVAVRGLALTFIDAVLDLTQGRGGVFDDEGTYTPSGREPRRIIPYSRSGRFLNPKPGFARDTRQLLLEAEPLVARGEIADAVALGAQILLEDYSDATAAAIVNVLSGDDKPHDPVEELRHNIAVAVGAAPLTAQAAVGMAFQALYPAIVNAVSFHPEIPGFSRLAKTLERVAFGMPVVNARKILGLIDAGIIAAPLTEEPDTEEYGIDQVINAVLAPTPTPPVRTDQDGFLPGSSTYAVIGRATEGWILGNDSLSRTMHDVIPRWARRVVRGISPTQVHGLPPLRARLEPWEAALAEDYQAADALLTRFSSPVNVLNTDAMLRNVDELVDAGAASGVDVRVFFARKANKALAFVDTIARASKKAGHGVDVASYRELAQVLDSGVDGAHIILSAAIKPVELLQLAIDNGVTISVDTVAELHRIAQLAHASGAHARVAPRLAPDPRFLPATRFGELARTWAQALGEDTAVDLSSLRVVGIHVHLHGYSAADRALALQEVFTLHDHLCGLHGSRGNSVESAVEIAVEFIDIGGGVPMSYIADAAQWEHFSALRNHGVADADITWKRDPLRTIYPYYQEPTRGKWLGQLLNTEIGKGTVEGVRTIADEFRNRGLRLHLEPGRSLLDGCGMTLARVEFVKRRADGLPLVGLAMNRTQTRTTSDDYTIDPLLIPQPSGHTGGTYAEPVSRPDLSSQPRLPSGFGFDLGFRPDPELDSNSDLEAYLVGAYCIEDELILRRRIRFPQGVKVGDIIAIPNTAGYFMHILESASHQIPLAHNVLWPAEELDRIDSFQSCKSPQAGR